MSKNLQSKLGQIFAQYFEGIEINQEKLGILANKLNEAFKE
jgi:hypothetical protein